jgi:hypothetical protein
MKSWRAKGWVVYDANGKYLPSNIWATKVDAKSDLNVNSKGRWQQGMFPGSPVWIDPIYSKDGDWKIGKARSTLTLVAHDNAARKG